MDAQEVVRERLARQRLSSAPSPDAAGVVGLLTCVQSQERDHAFYSLGLRSGASTYAAVRAELDAGSFLRTHILRPTWHFVRPDDLRWVLDLTSPRVLAAMGARHRQLGLDDTARLDAGIKLVAELLQGRRFLSRAEIGAQLVERRSPITPGEVLGHLLLVAELMGVVCSGPTASVHHTYALVDEVVPPAPPVDRDSALRELVRRFFVGHGPASVRDFTRWSSLTVAETKAALADLDSELTVTDVDGIPHWHASDTAPRRRAGAPAALLLPVYDEVVLSYPKVTFAVATGHPLEGRPDPFWAPVVARGVNVGVWKRSVGPTSVRVHARLAPGLSPEVHEEVGDAAARMARFLERDLDLAIA